jgi:hypothetical protein
MFQKHMTSSRIFNMIVYWIGGWDFEPVRKLYKMRFYVSYFNDWSKCFTLNNKSSFWSSVVRTEILVMMDFCWRKEFLFKYLYVLWIYLLLLNGNVHEINFDFCRFGVFENIAE